MDPAQLQPGYRLDRYELLCPLAYGGMASVWLARFGGRLGFERMVVIKMILPQYSQDPRFQEMFLDEARIASKIEHSNVARILDVGEHQENYFIVMEWVDGDSLSKVLRASEQRKERIPLGIAMRIVADAAAGLHAAHELKERDGTHLGVVHRDVSPQNILVANSGATMIIDFGVAKARDRVSQETSAGQLKGKIRYMAPEQALGRSIDHRADVWALGAMLYEMFTGNPPYDGPNEVATLHKLTSGQRPPAMPRTMPEPLIAVVERALGYEPEERFSTALELNLALEGAMVEINEPTTAAIVAHYTGQLLADRKAARKRAVDTALDAARKRDTGGQMGPHSTAMLSAPPSTGNLPYVPPSPASARSTVPLYTETPSHPSHPSPAGGPPSDPLNLSEAPSAASSGTIGSAAMEYPPPDMHIPNEAQRRKRYVAAAALGVSVAAGVIGAILIISSAVLKQDDQKQPSQATDPSSLAGHGQPPTQPAVTPTTSSTTDLDLPDNPTATGTSSSSGTAPPNGSIAHVDNNGGSNNGSSSGATAPKVPPHKPTGGGPVTFPKPKPTTPAPTTSIKDRGF